MKKSLRLPKLIRDKFCIFACLFTTSLFAQTFSIITDEKDEKYGCVQLENPPAGYPNKDLQVFLFPHSPDNSARPIIGEWEMVEENLYFCPLIPFTKSLTYQARFPTLPYFTFKAIEKENYTLTEIVEIFPQSTTLPENVLKFYLHFSAPMSDGNAYQYLKLVDEKGKSIANPFLALTPLLWNQDRTRLTLWFDPGRVKRDLLRNQKLGAPLEEGKNYTLHLSKNWKDANGYSLAKDFTKKISVVKADRISPNPKNWTIESPTANTTEPVIIHFGESLDHALATKSLTVFNKKGKRVKGSGSLQDQDKKFVFTPLNSWESNPYRIQIKGELEDLAGNNLNRLFDTNLEEQTTPKRDLPFYYVDFRVE